MDSLQPSISSTRIHLSRSDLADMIRLVRALFRLSRLPSYREAVWRQVPEIARFNPGHDAVMMGYDFHLSDHGPQLIEVNNNAGGGLLAYLAYQPDNPLAHGLLPERLRDQLIASFAEEMRRFTGSNILLPRRIVIIDENPEEQFLYPEMEIFRDLFADWCSCCSSIVDPSQLDAGAKGVFLDGKPVDLILQSPLRLLSRNRSHVRYSRCLPQWHRLPDAQPFHLRPARRQEASGLLDRSGPLTGFRTRRAQSRDYSTADSGKPHYG